MANMINLKIDGMDVSVPAGSTILEAARQVGIDIPTLCFMKEMNEIGACRICVVEVSEGGRPFRIVASCVYPVTEGMVVKTNSLAVQQSRKMTLELMLSTHERKCLSCVRSGNCEFQALCNDYGVTDEAKFDGMKPEYKIDCSAPHMIRDNNKCILCRRCVAACKAQKVGVIGANDRGIDTNVACGFNLGLADVGCVSCGQCIVNCPTGALREKDDTDKVFEALNDPEKIVIVQTAPAVRAALGEDFGMPIGTGVEGKMVAALKRLGFDQVFDTNVGADLTIMEEGSEFIERYTHRDQYKWPMFTSCCPGWIRFIKSQYPMFTDNLSTAKSPQQMFGAVAKSYFAEKIGVDPHKMFVVSIMPCVAKKSEAALPQMNDACGDPDVDVVLTTREMDRLFRSEHVPVKYLPETPFDSPLGTGTGAAVIFGATGGVMDAALRSAYYMVTGENPPADAFTEVRGIKGRKEATFTIPGAGDVKVAVVSGLRNTRFLMRDIRAGRARFDFVEIMACPGGCAGGGGQPIHDGFELAEERGDVLWQLDSDAPIRYSHENSDVQAIYNEYFERPLGERSHHLLHTDHHCWEMPPKKKPKYKF